MSKTFSTNPSEERRRVDFQVKFSIRMRPYEDTEEGALLSYLQNKGSRRQTVMSSLYMLWLPAAYKHFKKASKEEVKKMVLQSLRMIENHKVWLISLLAPEDAPAIAAAWSISPERLLSFEGGYLQGMKTMHPEGEPVETSLSSEQDTDSWLPPGKGDAVDFFAD